MSAENWEKRFPLKYRDAGEALRRIRRGDTIFIATACAEPKFLIDSFLEHASALPEKFRKSLRIIRLGISPYAEEKLRGKFRRESFFIDDSIRKSVNRGNAEYNPLFLSQAPRLLRRGLVRVDAALVQASPPDHLGYMSLGISIDVVKAAIEQAGMVIVQANGRMPRVHGDTFIHLDEVDYVIPHDEELIEFSREADTDISRRIGRHVAGLIQDGDTIQVGYGSIPNAILSSLSGKKDLGLHTELMGDEAIALMRSGVINNSRKTINRGKAVATFCMGRRQTYDYLNDNPEFEFRQVDYTNNPLVIAGHDNMVAINTALEIDLTGQTTVESIGKLFYSGTGGQADFMRGAALSRGGRSILALESTTEGGKVSRIVPSLKEGASAALIRGDIQYVVTEYGIAYLRGKSIRERAMELIQIAHPDFQPWLVEEAKKSGLVYPDQAFISGEEGRYPEEFEAYRTTKTGVELFFRPIKASDEPHLREFIHAMSDLSLYRRFISKRKDMPHDRLQELVVIDYTREMAIVVVTYQKDREIFAGVGRYYIDPDSHMAEVAFAVRDDYQGQGIGTELLAYLTYLAKRQGVLGFTADVLADNQPMLRVFEKGGFETERRTIAGLTELKMMFK